MSISGACAEGGVLPEVGSLVQLIRGSLIVHAIIVWSAQGRCGLKFSGGVEVDQWRASPVNAEQKRVDEVVRLVKAGAVPLPVPALRPTGLHREAVLPGPQLEGDLNRISGLLDGLGAIFASDADFVARYGPELQNLDIAMQMIDAVQSILAETSGPACGATRLLGLRRSADQALRRQA